MKKIAVCGDACLDYTRLGRISRTSPEDPRCPVVQIESERYELGMAGNVARWLAATHDVAVRLYCHQRDTVEGEILRRECTRARISCGMPRQPGTLTVKERLAVIEEGSLRCLTRIDRDSTDTLRPLEHQIFKDDLQVWRPDVIVVADYDKGFFRGYSGTQAIRTLTSLALAGTPVLINSKMVDCWRDFPARCLVCNQAEFQGSALGRVNGLQCVKAKLLMVTLSEKGVAVYPGGAPANEPAEIIPTAARVVVDMTGAGDAFLAGVALEMIKAAAPTPRELAMTGQRWAAHSLSQFGVGSPIAEQLEV